MSSYMNSSLPMETTGMGGGSEPGPLINLFVPLLMFCTGVLGNVVALVLLWRSRRGNCRSVFYRLLAGLTVTDLLGTLATSPVTLLVYSNDRQWVGGSALCDYFSFMMIFAGLATVLMVGCMAVERFLAILHPYTYERQVSPERANCILSGVWLVAALISCLPLLQVGRNVRHWPGTWCFFDFFSERTVDKVFCFFFACIGLLVIASTAVCNVAVMVVLLRMRRISQNMGKSREGRTLNMTSEMQMIFFLAGIILVFAACYAPLMVRIIMNVTQSVEKSVEADLMAIRLASVNQILDPWVYLLFRRRLAALLYSACKSVSPVHTLSSLKALRNSQFGKSLTQKDLPTLLPSSPPDSPQLGGGGEVMEKKLSVVAEEEPPQWRRSSGSADPARSRTGSWAVAVLRSSHRGTSSPEEGITEEKRGSQESSSVSQDQEADRSSLPSPLTETACESDAVLLEQSSFPVPCVPGYYKDRQHYQHQCVQAVCSYDLISRGNKFPEQTIAQRALCFLASNDSLTQRDTLHKFGGGSSNIRTTLDTDCDQMNSSTRTDTGIPNGTAPIQCHEDTTKKRTPDPRLGTKLTTSASWPVICRHGNQTIIRMDSDEDSENGDHLPLLTKRHSYYGPQCVLCRGEKTDLHDYV